MSLRHVSLPVFLAAAAIAACSEPAPAPSVEVTRRAFAHVVEAEGFLRSRSVAEVSVPSDVRAGASILWIAEDGSQVEKGEIVVHLDQFEMEQRLVKEETELASAEVERRRVETEGLSAVAGVTTRRDLAGLDLEHAERYRRTDLDVFSRTEILESRIREELARTRREHTGELEGVQAERARAAAGVVEVQRQRARVEVDEAQRALRALEIRAPASGIVIWARDWQGETVRIGEQVYRSQTLGAIPDMTDLEAEVFVLESDAGGLAPGAEAEIVIEAHPDAIVKARVRRIDPVSKRPFRGSPVQYFGVVLGLEEIDPAVMKAGQRVAATLVVDSWNDALVVPRQALFEREGSWIVYAATDQGPVAKEVEIEALTPSYAVIAAGVAEGERIALEEPSNEAAPSALGRLLARQDAPR
ncbi:MAG TPA: efflux RND transporter periplasmic adaptor subunit [Thermoanaerobaculia bacterium]|nr:efflux RND transporter periplasmic adaptor subunit [Thermoanaerobaculia bacterium]